MGDSLGDSRGDSLNDRRFYELLFTLDEETGSTVKVEIFMWNDI